MSHGNAVKCIFAIFLSFNQSFNRNYQVLAFVIWNSGVHLIVFYLVTVMFTISLSLKYIKLV
jgi:hypothetical protein